MDRSRSLDRVYRRTLVAGLGVSVIAHVGFLALEFEGTLPVESESVVALLPLVEEPEPTAEAVEVVQLQIPLSASLPDGAPSEAAPAAESMSSAAAQPVLALDLGAGAPAVSAAAAEVAFEELKVVDPMSMGEISPVVFTDLPAATVAETNDGEGEDDVEVYVPGSIGKAKRQWAGGDGTNTLGDGRGKFVITGGSGGHCPMPGRRPPVPVWKVADVASHPSNSPLARISGTTTADSMPNESVATPAM